MKAVVAQIQGKRAVLLTQEGAFVKVANRGYRLGQQISFSRERKHPARALLFAACLLIFFLGASGLAAERLPSYYVSLDVNPSIELTLNWFNRVLSLAAVNADAEPIVERLSEAGIVNRSLDAALGMVLTQLDESDYFSETEENDVVIAVVSYGMKNAKGLADHLEQSVAASYAAKPIRIRSVDADAAKLGEARKYHTTAGKLALVEEMASSQEGAQSIAVEEWLDKSVREILSWEQNARDPNHAADPTHPPAEASERVKAETPAQGSPQPTPSAKPVQNSPAYESVPVLPSPSNTVAPEAVRQPEPQASNLPQSTPGIPVLAATRAPESQGKNPPSLMSPPDAAARDNPEPNTPSQPMENSNGQRTEPGNPNEKGAFGPIP